MFAVVQDKNVVVLPRELSRHDIRLIMYNVLDIFGTTSNEKSIITRNTIQQLGFVQEVRCLALLQLNALQLLWPTLRNVSRLRQYVFQHFGQLLSC